MWHSDRPRTQQMLARDLAELVQVVGKENAFAFLEAFWITIAREWGGIDALRWESSRPYLLALCANLSPFFRMDKFLYLIRLYLRASLQQVADDNYHESAIAEYNRLISSVPLSPVDPKVPDGLRYHVLDIYVDELDAVGVLAKRKSIPFNSLLEPVSNIIERTKNKTVRKRAKETLADERIVGIVAEGDVTSNNAVSMETEQQDQQWNGVDD